MTPKQRTKFFVWFYASLLISLVTVYILCAKGVIS